MRMPYASCVSAAYLNQTQILRPMVRKAYIHNNLTQI